MFADDLAIVADSAKELQRAIDDLFTYCVKNGLKINVSKTKCMIFHRGRLPQCSFKLNDVELEIVNSFTYLGFKFSTQLSFSAHLNNVTVKANSRCGILMSRLPLRNLPLELVLQVFRCYVLPIFTYGHQLYVNECSKNSLRAADATFTKYLKRYLGIPYHANNSITHYLTSTVPLTTTLNTLRMTGLNAFTMPPEMHGYTLSFLNNSNANTKYDPLPLIPTYFWRSRSFHKLPTLFYNRKKLCYEIYDITHLDICSTEKFHILNHETCICRGCGQKMYHYHQYCCEL